MIDEFMRKKKGLEIGLQIAFRSDYITKHVLNSFLRDVNKAESLESLEEIDREFQKIIGV